VLIFSGEQLNMNRRLAVFLLSVLLGGWAGSVVLAEEISAEPAAAAQETLAEPAPAAAPDARALPPKFDRANTAWMLTSSALVLMMTAPGLALFYCGLVRKKNVLGVMMQCVFLMGILSIVWALWGYSLAFGDDALGGFVGNGKFLFLNNVMPIWDEAAGAAVVPMDEVNGIPVSVHMIFQMMFFIITPALICGAYAERMKFSAMVLFSVLWGTFVYCPLAHWVWSATGWLFAGDYMAIDFAGGTVVHISAGISALICAIVLGKRKGYGREAMPPHNLTYTCIGAALLWVGWFGFNAGSALASTAQAANAFVATHLAAAAGTVAWAGAEWLHRGKPSILGACSGAVAGLVCITPASGSINPLAGIVLGVAAGVVCYLACNLKTKLGYDDSLDAFGVHGVGGTLGALLTGVFATRAVLVGGAATGVGLLEGNVLQFRNQLIGIGAAMAIGIVGTAIILKLLDAVLGIRVSEPEEVEGLDVSQHGEEGYIFL
jgi:Amt family ammonium transporter